jgi:homoserine dehydrogenase
MRDIGLLSSRYYLRFAVEDRPGVLAQLAGILGEHDISIEQVVQEARREGRPATVIMLSHAALERDVKAALAGIDALPVVAAPTRFLRISGE